jgi:predicted DNA-binding protein (MmcQ/YjbR family)
LNHLTISAPRLRRLRELCLALPEATEKVAWGDPTWRVRDKIFAMQKGNYAGGRPSLWLKAPPGQQGRLVREDPERYFVPPYVGHKGWVGVYLDAPAPAWGNLRELVEASYRMTAPKSLVSAPPARTATAKRAPKRAKSGL